MKQAITNLTLETQYKMLIIKGYNLICLKATLHVELWNKQSLFPSGSRVKAMS